VEPVGCVIVVPWNTHNTVWSKHIDCEKLKESKENLSDYHWPGMSHEFFVNVKLSKHKREMFIKKFGKDLCNLQWLPIVFIVLIRIFCVVGILSNMVPIGKFILDITARTITFLPIILLSIVNLFAICIISWRTYGNAFAHEASSRAHLKFIYLVGEGTVALSTGYHVVFLAALKYFFRAYPTNCDILLSKRIIFLMALTIWVYSTAFSIILNDLPNYFPNADRITALISFQTINAGPAFLILLFIKWSHDTNNESLEDFSMFPESFRTSCKHGILSLGIVRSINRILKFYLFCWALEYIFFIAFFANTPGQVLENIFVFVFMEYLTSSFWVLFHCIAPIVYYYNTRQAQIILERLGCK
jgi:hypothetical protein